mmetsp:Transcript_78682/g.163621  ORF Transcript_78682/g.163621 Transcript_78682/m.163621 type:complete len:84 (+) Transcript_78682:740-991(+)
MFGISIDVEHASDKQSGSECADWMSTTPAMASFDAFERENLAVLRMAGGGPRRNKDGWLAMRARDGMLPNTTITHLYWLAIVC